MKTNFVLAGTETFVSLFSRFQDKTEKSYFNDEDLAFFLDNTVSKFLCSFGSGLNYKKKTIPVSHSDRFVDMVNQISECQFMKKTNFYWDSGGFQIANGALTVDEMYKFIDLYYQTIIDYPDLFDYSFILDLPPGPKSVEVFNSYEEVEKLNRFSYQRCSELIPAELKKRIIYIHHFRSPKLYSIWQKMLFEDDFADGFDYFGTGGIVAQASADNKIPIIIYSIPIVSILNHALNKGKKKFDFHVLGGASFRDVVFHKLFEQHIKEKYDIDLNITYDSSILFKGLAIARFLPILEDGRIKKVSMKSSNLDKFYENKIVVKDKIYGALNSMAEKFNFKKLNEKEDPIYLEDDTFNRTIYLYSCLYVLYTYSRLEEYATNEIKDMYSKDYSNFVPKLKKLLTEINNNKQSNKVKLKCSASIKSLELFDSLDTDYCQEVVNKLLSQDDLKGLNNKELLTW